MKNLKAAALAITMVFFCGAAFAGPISQLYITQYGGTNGAIIQGDTVLGTFTTTSVTQTGIAVGDTVRIIRGFRGQGSEYDLQGNVINAGIYTNDRFSSLYDGTTDGQYNYAIDHNGNGYNTVFQFDLGWENARALFTTDQRSSGITYDALTETFWTTGGSAAPNGAVQNYDKNGMLLSEFNKGSYLSYGLAFDMADSTLWLSEYATSNLHQYSTDGLLLQTISAPFTNVFGMEFRNTNTVPEPTTLVLLALGLAGLGLRKKKQA